MPNIFFFCLGLAEIIFQLDAVKFPIELILSKITTKVPSARVLLGESPGKASDRVCRLR